MTRVTSPSSTANAPALPGRGTLSLLTGVFFLALYGVYSQVVSPLVRPPHIESPADSSETGGVISPSLTNLQIAREHLPHVKWAGDAKYQFRTANSFVFAEETEQVDENNGIRFTPFAMVWNQKGRKPDEPPITIVSKSAYVRFASKFDITKPKPGRVIGGSLEDEVEIRGPNGMRIYGRDFSFSEASMRLWSDAPVRFAFGPHRGHAHGMQCELIGHEGPQKPDKLAVNGIQSVRLLRDVEMNLVFEHGRMPGQQTPKENRSLNTETDSLARKNTHKKPVLVKIQCDGNFNFGVQTHIATFEDDVRVYRPTEHGKFDVLMCDLLTMIFEPDESKKSDEPIAQASTGNASEKTESSNRFRGMNGKLTFRRLRAQVQNPEHKVVLISESNRLTTYATDLIHDAQTHVAVLTDPVNVRVFQETSELESPKLTLLQDKRGRLVSLWCQGAGTLKHRDKKTREIDMIAKWKKQLRKYPDPHSELDLIDLEEDAELIQPREQSNLQAQFIRLWVDRKRQVRDTVASSVRQNTPEKDSQKIRPRRLLALDKVTMLTPTMHARTKRLEAWFEESRNSRQNPRTAPTSQPRLRDALIPTSGLLRNGRSPTSRSSQRQSFFAVESPRILPANNRSKFSGPQLGISSGQNNPTPEKQEPILQHNKRSDSSRNDGPMKIYADLIRVRIVNGLTQKNSKVKEVWTYGHVDVQQNHEPGTQPLKVNGQIMHVINRSKDDQLMHVYGKPAHVRDRGRHIEGENIHLDRGKNYSWVEGPGLLQIPVEKTLEGKKLPQPQLLDVWWKKQMLFDGNVAKFRGGVRAVIADSRMRCETMDVFMAEPVSFTKKNRTREAKIQKVVCAGIVDFDSYEYVENKLMQMRQGRFVSLTIHHQTGDTVAQGPGRILVWKRGGAKRARLSPFATAKANTPARTEKNDWEYTRIDFSGQALGNTKQRFNTFYDRVRIVYGPVKRPPLVVDADNLPKNGGWMRSRSLQITQHEKTETKPAYITLLARGNAELDGEKFHGRADNISYDESKGLYILKSFGKRKATIWRQTQIGGEESQFDAQRMEFIPSKNRLKLDRTTRLDGIR